MATANTIEINGKLFDARTGRPIGSDAKKIVTNAVKKHARTKPNTGTVDGFRAPSKPTAQKKTASTPKKTATRTTSAGMKRKPRQSVTLHRGAVRQPALSTTAKTPPKVQSTALKTAQNRASANTKKVQKSPLVSRFGSALTTQTPTRTKKATTPEVTAKKQGSKASDPTPVDKKEQFIQTALAHTVSEGKQGTQTHPAKQKGRKKLRLASIGSAALAVLIVGMYVAYLNIPDVSIRVAAYRAGFAASLPNYRPTGYSLHGPIEYHPGQVTINFRGSDPSKVFSLTQQESTWDSTALLENYVAQHTQQYVTYQDRGLTIYIFDGSNATWVNGGKMYSIAAENVQLDTDQILKLATSM